MAKLPAKSPQYEANKKNNKTCVLLYSGGVDTSICVHLLQHYYGYKVITLTIDVFQDSTYAQKMADKAKKLGAVKTIIYDAKDEFADHYLSQVIAANGLYDGKYPLGTSIARPMQAKIAVETSIAQGADAMAHGCKGRGADAFRLNMVFNYLLPKKVDLVMPINDWWPTRQEEVDYAYANKIPVGVAQNNPFSYDDNIMSNAINYGVIDDTEQMVPEEAYKWTVTAEQGPEKPALVKVAFEQGLPVAVNGTKMKLAQLIQHLNKLGGKHGVGRVDMIENGLYGNKFRWVYEAPAAVMLIAAHQELEKLVLPKATQDFKHGQVDPQWTKLAYHSAFYAPLAKSLMAFISTTQQYVNGEVTLKLYKGNFGVVSWKSLASLIKLDTQKMVAKEAMNTVPYGFEEYSFASVHPEVIGGHLHGKK